jgi:putrescine transport system ATP-binding protein
MTMSSESTRPLHEDRNARRQFAPWTVAGAKPLVRFESLTKRFGPVSALDAVSLDIFEGEFFALLGPSGCGKTTLLRSLAGFEIPEQGCILLDGKNLAGVPPHRRPVNMMFQSYALFPHLSVERNIAFGLKQEGLSKGETATRVQEALALVRLEGFNARKPHQLSGGERQRVALARALVKRPRVLLLDEPMAALDKKLRGETQFELMHLQERLRLTFVIVTHDQEEAMTVADRIAVMDRGRLVQVATPPEIYEQPNSRWVADFIGDVNLIEGRVVAADAAGTLIETATVGAVRGPTKAGLKVGDKAWVALRPEKMRIGPDHAPATSENCVIGTVANIAYLGDLSLYRVRLDTGVEIKAALANVTRLTERPINAGDRVRLTWATEAGVVLTQ